MDKDFIISQAVAYINEVFKDESSGHDRWHTLRVLNMAERLAKEENADLFIVRLAALLHDVDDIKLSPGTNAGLLRARTFMEKNSVESRIIDSVLTIIREISFKGTDSVVPSTLEGKCVQDADRLDAIGAIGVARAFAFGGSRGRSMYDPNIPFTPSMNEEEYRASSSSSINHFYEKLFLLKDMMNTASAKAIAEARDDYMHGFIDRFLSEWAGEK